MHDAACDTRKCRFHKARDGCPDQRQPLVRPGGTPDSSRMPIGVIDDEADQARSSELFHKHIGLALACGHGKCPRARRCACEPMTLTSFASALCQRCHRDADAMLRSAVLDSHSTNERHSPTSRTRTAQSYPHRARRLACFCFALCYYILRRRLIPPTGLLCQLCRCWPPQEDHHPVWRQRQEPRKRHRHLRQSGSGQQGFCCPPRSQDRRPPD